MSSAREIPPRVILSLEGLVPTCASRQAEKPATPRPLSLQHLRCVSDVPVTMTVSLLHWSLLPQASAPPHQHPGLSPTSGRESLRRLAAPLPLADEACPLLCATSACLLHAPAIAGARPGQKHVLGGTGARLRIFRVRLRQRVEGHDTYTMPMMTKPVAV